MKEKKETVPPEDYCCVGCETLDQFIVINTISTTSKLSSEEMFPLSSLHPTIQANSEWK